MLARAKFEGGDQSETSQCYVTPNALILIAALSLSVVAHPAQAEVMSAAEIAEQIVDKDLVARRMGARVHLSYDVSGTLLHKSAADCPSPFPGQTYPATSVTGMPSAVKPLSTATLTWNSAT